MPWKATEAMKERTKSASASLLPAKAVSFREDRAAPSGASDAPPKR